MVREFKSKDANDVKKMILTILKKEYPFDRSAYADSDINDIKGTYFGNRNTFFVCDKNSHVIGTAGIKKDTEKTALLRRIFVKKENRGQGCAKELVNKCIDFCKDHGYKEIVFRATDKMKQAMSLVQKSGFEEVEDLQISGFHIHIFKMKL